MSATLYFCEWILTGAVVLKCFALEILLHYFKLLETPESFCLAYISFNYITNWKRGIWKRMGCSGEIDFILQFLHISFMFNFKRKSGIVLFCKFAKCLALWKMAGFPYLLLHSTCCKMLLVTVLEKIWLHTGNKYILTFSDNCGYSCLIL